MKREISILFTIFLSVAFFLTACSSKKEDLPLLKQGSKAPDFVLTDLNGKAVNFKKDFEGKKVFLNFWASWCASCKEEMKALEKAYRAGGDRGFNVMGINVYQDKENVEKFVQELGLTFPILLDREGEVAKAYNVFGIPVSYVIEPSGIVKEKYLGGLSQEQLKEIIDNIFS